MWSPADITAFPTAEDLIDAKVAIKDTECLLQAAISELLEAQRRVDSLERDLSERKAWIAPVRRLTSDTLSLIFEFCGLEGWRPLMNIAISRLWRDIALDTPRAWSFHTFAECATPDLFQLILGRTGQLPLHIDLPRKIPFELLTDILSRFQCLKASTLPFETTKIVFPKVKRLSLYGFFTLTIADIDISRFPAIESLDCSIYLTNTEADLSGTTTLQFAPLKTIEFTYSETRTWLPILWASRNTLVSMSVRYADLEPLGIQDVIALPNLIYLKLQRSYGEEGMIFPVDLETPVLETLQVDFPLAYSSLRDTTTVEYLCIEQEEPTMDQFANLRVLFICDSLLEVLDQLLTDTTLCPKLESIELSNDNMTEREGEILLEVNSNRSQPIKVTRGWTTGLPEYITHSCGVDIPCHTRH